MWSGIVEDCNSSGKGPPSPLSYVSTFAHYKFTPSPPHSFSQSISPLPLSLSNSHISNPKDNFSALQLPLLLPLFINILIMSTTTVCRELQSCLEPQLVEPLTLSLTLAPHKEADSIKDNVATTGEFGGWSFIESLVKDNKGTPYVHPLDKSSSSVLSTKSLELCTESLGSETGSDIGSGSENDLYSSSSSDSESRKSPTRGRSRFCQLIHKKAIRRSFPPPLTSISGSDSVQYTPHREGGRLVIKATKIATTKTCFQVERSDGRLRLRFKNGYNSSSSSEEDTDNDEEQVEERESCLNNKIDGNTSSEDEMAIVKYQRPCSWYKESGQENKRLLNWKPFMGVAI